MAEGGYDRSMSETKSDPGNSSIYSRHSQNYVESVSVEICTIMNSLGNGKEMRQWRVEKYKELDRLVNARPRNAYKITAGSKAEGLTSIYESDEDILFVINHVLCVEDGSNLHTIPYDTELYRMDTRVYPGHCILFLERQGPSRYNIIDNALCDNGMGDVLLSSGLLVDELLTIRRKFPHPQYNVDVGMVQHERAGPSLPVSYQGLYFDMVYSLRCHCPSILQTWAVRPRHWPSPTIVQKIVSLGAYLTPVGFKGSENKHMEWRICFNTGEAELVSNLNGTHAKVYVLLKMILKMFLGLVRKK